MNDERVKPEIGTGTVRVVRGHTEKLKGWKRPEGKQKLGKQKAEMEKETTDY